MVLVSATHTSFRLAAPPNNELPVYQPKSAKAGLAPAAQLGFSQLWVISLGFQRKITTQRIID